MSDFARYYMLAIVVSAGTIAVTLSIMQAFR